MKNIEKGKEMKKLEERNGKGRGDGKKIKKIRKKIEEERK